MARRRPPTTGLSLFGFAFIALVLTTGCTDGDSSDPSLEGSASKPKVALIMKSFANKFFKTMANGASAH